ncbi:capsid cement protein [Phascolarctobacterium sp.]|uniref:capsid cement protein n=1 Tax=Phascolarctobacterium sp. TaxID=2049039 RepID=UPI00386A21F0
MAKYRQKGNRIMYKCADAVAQGEVVMIGKLAGVAEVGGAAGDEIALTVSGVFEFTAGGTVAVGDSVAYASGKVTKAASDATAIGVAVSAGVVNGEVLVRLN